MKNQEILPDSLNNLESIECAVHSCITPPKDHDLFSKPEQSHSYAKSVPELETKDNKAPRQFNYYISTGIDCVASNEEANADYVVFNEEYSHPNQQNPYNQFYAATDFI